MIGKTFNRWTIINVSSKRDIGGNAYWLCECSGGFIGKIVRKQQWVDDNE
jgi:hypothetical protein